MKCTHMHFSRCIYLRNHFNNQDVEHFYHPASQSSLCPLAVTQPIHPSLGGQRLYYSLDSLAYFIISNNCSHKVCTPPIWLLHLTYCLGDSSVLLHISLADSSLLLSSIPLFEQLFIWSPKDRHLDCFYFVATMNKNARNTSTEVF